MIPARSSQFRNNCLQSLLLALLLTACSSAERQPPGPTMSPPTQIAAPAPATKSEVAAPDRAPEIAEAAAPVTTAEPEDPEESAPATLQEADRQASMIDDKPDPGPSVLPLCHAVGSKLGSVTINDCLRQQLQHDLHSPLNYSLAYRDYLPVGTRIPLGRVLVIGGIHGDEYSSVSLMFKWMDILNQHHSGLFHWRFIPLANPDGLLRETSQRQNQSGVDLNRNFPTADWDDQAHRYWTEVTYNNPRRNPGANAASELETRWLIEQINDFSPDAIISVHAPHHLVDYDGPPRAPDKLGHLSLNKQGVFPGSLGNYAGIDLGLPVVTVELQSAGIMPRPAEIDTMWVDLVGWLRRQFTESTSARSD